MPNVLLNIEKKIHLKTVSSTNDYLKENKIEPGFWVSADEQTSGRGRKNKSWNSFGEDKLIFSGKIRFEKIRFSVSLFSLLAGSAVLKALMKANPEIENSLTIKWPNDIYRDEKKIAGILIECEQEKESLEMIIGIGVNIFGRSIPDDLTKSGFLFDNKPPIRAKEMISEFLIITLNEASVSIENEDMIDKEISFALKKSYLIGKKIKTILNDRKILGKQTGFSSDGFLIIETENGERFELMDTDPNFEVIDESKFTFNN